MKCLAQGRFICGPETKPPTIVFATSFLTTAHVHKEVFLISLCFVYLHFLSKGAVRWAFSTTLD